MTHVHVAIKTTYISMLGNAALAALKLVTGIAGNSYALIADAIESTTDILSSFLVLLGLKYANKPADENHPYGHGRAEPLFTFVVVGFLIFSALWIAHSAIGHLQEPREAPAPYTLIILGFIIVWKEISYRYVLRKSKETHSSSLKADAWHHRSDAITSVAAFIGITIALVMGEGYAHADDYAALCASAMILYNSYLIFRPALAEIMDEHVYDELVADIRKVAQKVDGIDNTEKCFIRKAGMKYHVDLHARVNGNLSVKEGHDLAHQLKDRIKTEIPEIEHVLIHIEPS